MESKRREVDQCTRKLVIKLCSQGKSLREIGEIVGRRHSTVQKIINKWKYEGTLKNKKGRGRKRILSEQDERIIVREMKKNPKASVPKLTLKMSEVTQKAISTETVRRVLRKNNLNGRIARKKPLLSTINIHKRLEFAKKYIKEPQSFWDKVIFTDETKVNLFGSDGRKIVWRKPNESLKMKNLVSTVKHGGGSVMLWGSMAASGVGNMEFIETTMNKTGYLEILKRNVRPTAERLGLSADFYYQQDNDPKHSSYLVKEWMLYNVRHQLKTPPQSPDLNPIENLWREIKIRVANSNPSNKTELKKKIRGEWENIEASYTKKLVESMPRRLQAVIDAKSGHTKY